MDFKMQSHPAGLSGMVMLLSGTVGSGFASIPVEMAANIFERVNSLSTAS